MAGIGVDFTERDSASYIEEVFKAKLGVEGLGKYVHDRVLKGDDEEMILNDLRYQLDTTDAGKAAFNKYAAIYPNMKEFASNPQIFGQVEVPEFAYGEYRRTVRGAAARYGVDSSLTSDAKIVDYLRKFNDPTELVQRMQKASIASSTTPPETLAYLRQNYGLSNSDLTSFFLDPTTMQEELVKRYDASRIAGEALRNQFNVSTDYAENLVAQGYTAADSAKAFDTASAMRSLTSGTESVSEQDLINAQFGDAAAVRNVKTALGSRTAKFEQGGGYIESQRGVSGLGSSTS